MYMRIAQCDRGVPREQCAGTTYHSDDIHTPGAKPVLGEVSHTFFSAQLGFLSAIARLEFLALLCRQAERGHQLAGNLEVASSTQP